MLNLLSQLWTSIVGKVAFSIQRYVCFRPYILPVIVGLCLGITIHMMFVPFLEEGCDVSALRFAAKQQMMNENFESRSPQQEQKTFEPEDIFEARLVQPAATNASSNRVNPKPKIIRPRYIATELGIREKLFVGVLTSAESVDSFGIAMDKTVAKFVTKIVFFSMTKPVVVPSGLPMITFGVKNSELLPVHVLKYISEHFGDTYDFYMFVSDRTYLRAEKLLDLVEHISVREDVHMGAPSPDTNFCSLEGGVIISHSIMSRVLKNLDWCLLNPHPDNPSITLGRCIHQATQKLCSPKGEMQSFKYVKLNDFDYDDDITKLKSDPAFNQSVAFYPMPDDISLYKLHRYFCFVDLNETRQKINSYKDDIISLSQHSPGGREAVTWPLGVPEPHKPTNRFGVLEWTYFTETHIFLDVEIGSLVELIGSDKLDIQDIMRFAMTEIKEKYKNRYLLRNLVNGYRKWDPTRGMEYILDLLLQDAESTNSDVFKRFHLIRPLGEAELVPMPYVSENMLINLVIFLHPADVDMFDVFLDSYVRSCLQLNEDISLTIALLYPSIPKTATEKDLFARPKSLIADISKKYSVVDKLKWQAFEDRLSEIEMMDEILATHKADVLIMTGTVNMELQVDDAVHFLNRIRLNTVKGVQVFFPMGFWQYKPSLTYNRSPPANVEMAQRYGQYDTRAFDVGSFYLSDYKTARKTLSPITAKMGDIITMFVNYQKFHIFRAVEQNLRLKWMNLTCSPHLSTEKFQECVQRNIDGLASQRHLGLLISEYNHDVIRQPNVLPKDPVSKSKDRGIGMPVPHVDRRLLQPLADIDSAL